MADTKLTWVHLQDYAGYKDETINIDPDKSILKIEGTNNSGKSAIFHALSSLFANSAARAQAAMVRNGADSSIVEAGFSDGTILRHVKYKSGPEEYAISKGGDDIWSSREGTALTAIQGIPEPVAEFIDLVVTKSAILNFRSDDDPLMFVNTKEADNYSVLNEVLRTEDLVLAGNDINSDINDLNAEANSKVMDAEALSRQADNYIHCTPALAKALGIVAEGARTTETQLEDTQALGSDVSGLIEAESQTRLKTDIFGVAKRFSDQLDEFIDVLSFRHATDSLVDEQSKVSCSDALSLSYEQFDKVSQSLIEVSALKDEVAGLAQDEKKYNAAKGLANVQGHYLKDVPALADEYSEIGSLLSDLTVLASEQKTLDEQKALKDSEMAQLKTATDVLRASGYAVGVCPNCQAPVVLDTESGTAL